MMQRKESINHLIMQSHSGMLWLSKGSTQKEISLENTNQTPMSKIQEALKQINTHHKKLHLYLPCIHGSIQTLTLPTKRALSDCPESAYSQTISATHSLGVSTYKLYIWEKEMLNSLYLSCKEQGFHLQQLFCWPIFLLNQQQNKRNHNILIASKENILLHYQDSDDCHTILITRANIPLSTLLTLVINRLHNKQFSIKEAALMFFFSSQDEDREAQSIFRKQQIKAKPIPWNPLDLISNAQ